MAKMYIWDYMSESFDFQSDPEKCVHCGLCREVCSTSAIYEDEQGVIRFPEELDGHVGWGGCYRCQRCMAVCPTGAIRIFGKKPEDSLPRSLCPDGRQMEALLRNRRSCRHFQDREIPREEIDEMLRILENIPTGSNLQSLEFSVVYQKAEMDKFRKLVHKRALELAEQGIFPGVFQKDDFENQIELEKTRNFGDVFFANAPHMLIVHSKKGRGTWHVDPHLADAYWDMICQSRGYGSLIMTLPVGTINNMPDVKALLGIPEDHYFDVMMGFGYPAVTFARGVQREGRCRVHEITFPTL